MGSNFFCIDWKFFSDRFLPVTLHIKKKKKILSTNKKNPRRQGILMPFQMRKVRNFNFVCDGPRMLPVRFVEIQCKERDGVARNRPVYMTESDGKTPLDLEKKCEKLKHCTRIMEHCRIIFFLDFFFLSKSEIRNLGFIKKKKV